MQRFGSIVLQFSSSSDAFVLIRSITLMVCCTLETKWIVNWHEFSYLFFIDKIMWISFCQLIYKGSHQPFNQCCVTPPPPPPPPPPPHHHHHHHHHHHQNTTRIQWIKRWKEGSFQGPAGFSIKSRNVVFFCVIVDIFWLLQVANSRRHPCFNRLLHDCHREHRRTYGHSNRRSVTVRQNDHLFVHPAFRYGLGDEQTSEFWYLASKEWVPTTICPSKRGVLLHWGRRQNKMLLLWWRGVQLELRHVPWWGSQDTISRLPSGEGWRDAK